MYEFGGAIASILGYTIGIAIPLTVIYWLIRFAIRKELKLHREELAKQRREDD